MNIAVDGHQASLYHQCWKRWGQDAQIFMLIEEAAELVQAGCKFTRNGNIEGLAEEMADTLIMIEQICQELGLEKRVTDARKLKLARLESRLRQALESPAKVVSHTQ
jgi:NTP pyrophosphatase (non-canonical NTP hydrolase)